jgi:transcriptional regulator with XRE-family HTH domain
MTNEELLTHLGIEFKVARIRKKQTIKQVSEKTGLSEQAIGDLENGKTDCHILTYKRVFDALEMDVKVFL